MRKRFKDLIQVICMIGLSILAIIPLYSKESSVIRQYCTIPENIEPNFYKQTPKEGLYEALVFYDLYHPNIVYAQAILETGNFTSGGCKKDNNLFGLYDSKNKCYYKFNHWYESVEAYKKWIQKRYKPGEDYYNFLKRIHYAEDPNYTKILKRIVDGENRRTREPSKGN